MFNRMDSMMFGLVVVISLILSPIAVAKIEVKENTTYYDVVVAEPENLATVLKQSTTISRSGNTFYGQTRYSINWTYNANVKKGFCKVGKPRVTAIINTTLPKLDKIQRSSKNGTLGFPIYVPIKISIASMPSIQQSSLIKHSRN